MTHDFTIRPVGPEDVAIVARHRAEMFKDMGQLAEPYYSQLVAETIERLRVAVPSGEYVGWFATPAGKPGEVLSGVGMQLRRTLPHPGRRPGVHTLAKGRQALVINMFTELPWRRRGLARLLMDHLLAWCDEQGVETVVLHASDEGRPLYERLGFVATNEMRFVGPPAASGTATAP